MALTNADFTEGELRLLRKLKDEGLPAEKALERFNNARAELRRRDRKKGISEGSRNSAVSPNAAIGQPNIFQRAVTRVKSGVEATKETIEKGLAVGAKIGGIVAEVRPEEHAEFIKKQAIPKPGVLERTITGFKSGVETAKETRVGIEEAQAKGEIGTTRATIEKTGAQLQKFALPVSRAVQGALEPISEFIAPTVEKIAGTGENILDTITKPLVNKLQKLKSVKDAQKVIQNFFDDPQNRRSLVNLGRTLESGSTIVGAGVAGAGLKAVSKSVVKKTFEKGAALAAKTPEVVKPILSSLRETTKKAIGPLSKIVKKRQLSQISEIIRPKLTKKAKALAIREKRVTEGKKRFFRTTKKDIVAPGRQTQAAAKSIQELIPKANKMDQFTLSNALDDTASKIAQELSSDMKNVAVNKSSLKKASKKWDDLKEKQALDPEFQSFKSAGNSSQKLFQNFLDETSNAKTLDDLWDIRKRYDKVIKDTVKQADITSDVSRQLQKEIWRENREILNDLLKETSDGLGDRVKKDFSDMSNLYSARQNIIQRSDILTKDKPGILKKFIKGAIPGAGIGVGIRAFSD